jgi:hypothetical protein
MTIKLLLPQFRREMGLIAYDTDKKSETGLRKQRNGKI